jgi:hypothetical protein
MRASAIGLALVVVVAGAGGAALDRAVSQDADASATRVFTGRIGDVFVAHGPAARCVVSQEAGAPRLSCRHTPLGRGRYDVVFFKDNLFVYRNGRPDTPVFSAHGKP